MKLLHIDIRPADDIWREQYGDPTMMSVRIGEEYNGRLHYSSVLVSLENALILHAAQDLCSAVRAYNDFLTPNDEAVKLGMNALDKAEGRPIGTSWDAYIHRNSKSAIANAEKEANE